MSAPASERIGEYLVVEPLGAGGMSEVFVARREGLANLCVLKRLRKELLAHPTAVKRFERECRVVRKLDHPNIARVLDAGEWDAQHCLVMELIDGVSLAELQQQTWAAGEKLPLSLSLSIGLEVLGGLTAAHAAGATHRDITPGNVMLGFDGTVKLIDFGLVRDDGDDLTTKTGTFLGTARYCSPEQAAGEPTDLRTDLYSCSVVIWEMLAGRALVDETDLLRQLHAVISRAAPLLRDLDPRISAEISDIVNHGLEKRCEVRLGSARQYLASLIVAAAPLRPYGPEQRRAFLRGRFPALEARMEQWLDRARRAPPASRPALLEFAGTDRYSPLSMLGEGGMGAVYEVTDELRGVRVALKIMTRVAPRQLVRFKREFRAVAELRHPHLVRLFDLGEAEGRLFYTMELVSGEDLAGHVRATRQDDAPQANLQRDPSCDLARLMSALPQILDALEFLHANDIVHRDIKASNVLLDAAGVVKLVDFGIVRDTADPTRTVSGRGLTGTVAYMAPEQILRGTIGPPADVYALGGLLFHLVAGRLPFFGTREAILVAHINTPPPSLAALVPAAPPALDRACLAMMAKRPADRPSIAELRELLGFEARRPVVGRRRHEDLVARADLLALLERRLDEAERGRLRFQVIAGETGAGKTALIDVVSTRAARRGFEVFRGRCFEREAIAYRAFDKILDDLAAWLAQQPPAVLRGADDLVHAAEQVFASFGVISHQPSAEAEAMSLRGVDPQALRNEAYGAIIELLGMVPAPVLLVIDDLHWTDRESLELLEALLRGARGHRLCIVVGLRSEVLGTDHPLVAFLDAYRGDPTHDTTTLTPFDEEGVAEILAREIGAPAPREVVRAVHEETEGNAFFTAEAARYLRRRARVEDQAERWHVPKLSQLVALRFASLSKNALRILSYSAVAGTAVPREVLRVASELEVGEFDLALDQLISEQILRIASKSAWSGAYDLPIDFDNDRLRSTVALSLHARRAVYHRRLAEALEQHPATVHGMSQDGAISELLARTWYGAGDAARTAEHAIHAAEAAARRMSFDRAAELYRLALEFEEVSRAARHWARYAEVLDASGDTTHTEGAYEQAIARAEPAEKTRLLARLGRHLVDRGRLLDAERTFSQVLEGYGLRVVAEPLRALVLLRSSVETARAMAAEKRTVTPDTRARYAIFAEVIGAFEHAWPLAAAEFQLRSQLVAQEQLDRAMLSAAHALEARALVLAEPPDLDGAERALARTVEQAPDDLPKRAWWTLAHQGYLMLARGRAEDAGALCRNALGVARSEAWYHRREGVTARAWLMLANLRSGREEEALAVARELAGPDRIRLGLASLGAVVAAVRLGQLDEAESWVRRLAHPEDEPFSSLVLYGAIADNHVDLARGRAREVIDRVVGFDDLARSHGCLRVPSVAALWYGPVFDAIVALADRQARRNLRGFAIARGRDLANAPSPADRALGRRALAQAAALAGEAASVHSEIDRALALSESAGDPYERWRCLHVAGRVGRPGPSAELEALARRYHRG